MNDIGSASEPRDGMRSLGRDGPRVSELCVGTSPLGGMPGVYGYDVDAETAIETVESAFRQPSIAFLDTSNNYGSGESERRIGEAIRRLGVHRLHRLRDLRFHVAGDESPSS